MREPNDWRLNNQESYLKGVVLTKRAYLPASVENDHDHCEFCGAKFMTVVLPDTLQLGYATDDGYRWVCVECLDDFSDMFEWEVIANA